MLMGIQACLYRLSALQGERLSETPALISVCHCAGRRGGLFCEFVHCCAKRVQVLKAYLPLAIIALVLLAAGGLLVIVRRRRAGVQPPRRASSGWAPLPGQGDAHRWRIRYVDSQGKRSARVIRVISAQFQPPAINAWCELQGRERQFLVERIEQANDLKTGAVVDMQAWLAARRFEQSKLPPSRQVRAA
jgi:hypothetical protein